MRKQLAVLLSRDLCFRQSRVAVLSGRRPANMCVRDDGQLANIQTRSSLSYLQAGPEPTFRAFLFFGPSLRGIAMRIRMTAPAERTGETAIDRIGRAPLVRPTQLTQSVEIDAQAAVSQPGRIG